MKVAIARLTGVRKRTMSSVEVMRRRCRMNATLAS